MNAQVVVVGRPFKTRDAFPEVSIAQKKVNGKHLHLQILRGWLASNILDLWISYQSNESTCFITQIARRIRQC